MFVLKILTTVWLALTAFGTSSTMLDEKETVSSRLLGAAVMLVRIYQLPENKPECLRAVVQEAVCCGKLKEY